MTNRLWSLEQRELKVNMVFNVHRNHKPKPIRDGEKGEGVWRWGEREIIYLSLHCVITRMIPALRWAAMRAILMFQ